MKTLLFCCTIALSTLALAEEKLRYKIITQYYNSSLHQDSIRVSGKITYDKVPEKGNFGRISSLDFRSATAINVDGTYTITFHKKCKGFYYFQNGYREIVVKPDFQSTNHNQYEIDLIGETHFGQIMVEKPIIYCYNPTPIEVDISLSPVGKLAFTYPIYQEGWHIRTTANGQIQDLNTGKHYPYLFWEAQQDQLNFEITGRQLNGFTIKTDTIIHFLEHQLTNMGLNSKEATDFITYWAPRIQQKPYAILQFNQGASYTQTFGGIHFSKTPDVLLRVGLLFALFEAVPQHIETTPQTFTPIQRQGFTVIEWGGAELTSLSNILAQL